MDYSYDIETARAKIPPAIENMEELITIKFPAFINVCLEAAKEVNAPTLTKLVSELDEACEVMKGFCKELLGDEGDSATTGTVNGANKAVKQMEAAFIG